MVWVWSQTNSALLFYSDVAVVNEVKCFAFVVDSQLFIHALVKLSILYGLWKPSPPSTLPFLLSIWSPWHRGAQLLSYLFVSLARPCCFALPSPLYCLSLNPLTEACIPYCCYFLTCVRLCREAKVLACCSLEKCSVDKGHSKLFIPALPSEPYPSCVWREVWQLNVYIFLSFLATFWVFLA